MDYDGMPTKGQRRAGGFLMKLSLEDCYNLEDSSGGIG